ncbi:transketolase [Gemmiger formicilis]|uniref:transketolase n=1 Tax=Gemmiger formicilis TaxID=745368 RepID=UPI00195DE456|nr:transketolase [Gemmiger formicilis]MBM6916641.1 transketolase [Gemmiger formicilis]HIX34205.1 transketolase [Candidatus Gemmiger avium]
MEQSERIALRRAAARLRLDVLEEVFSAQSGHPGGALSSAEIFTWLYNKELNVDPAQPRWSDRDRFVLSKGHSSPGLYAALARRGFFDPALLPTFRKSGSILQGHPDMKKIPGVDMTSGSLGQGVSAACGMALAAKLDGASWRVYTLLGDGEMEEGQVWEAAMFAAHKKLDNMCWIVDSNGLQIDGRVEDVAGPGPLDKKFEGFGFHVLKVDGHDFDALEAAFAAARAEKGRPTVILASTVKGKGVSFMEDQAGWHGKAPNAEQYAQAKQELEAELARWEVE